MLEDWSPTSSCLLLVLLLYILEDREDIGQKVCIGK